MISARKATPASCAVDWFDPERGLRLYLRDLVDLPGRPARPPQPRTGDDPSPGTHGGDRIAKAHAAHTTLSAELERDTGAEELAVRLG